MAIFSEPFRTEAPDKAITKQRTENTTKKDIKKKNIQITQCTLPSNFPKTVSRFCLSKKLLPKDSKH